MYSTFSLVQAAINNGWSYPYTSGIFCIGSWPIHYWKAVAALEVVGAGLVKPITGKPFQAGPLRSNNRNIILHYSNLIVHCVYGFWRNPKNYNTGLTGLFFGSFFEPAAFSWAAYALTCSILLSSLCSNLQHPLEQLMFYPAASSWSAYVLTCSILLNSLCSNLQHFLE